MYSPPVQNRVLQKASGLGQRDSRQFWTFFHRPGCSVASAWTVAVQKGPVHSPVKHAYGRDASFVDAEWAESGRRENRPPRCHVQPPRTL